LIYQRYKKIFGVSVTFFDKPNIYDIKKIMADKNQQKDDCGCGPGMVRKDGKCVMPDVTFAAFFMALNTSALFHLGEIPDPVTGSQQKDLLMAKHTIDTMSMLSEKTKGNLDAEDAELVENSIYDLKMRYIKAESE